MTKERKFIDMLNHVMLERFKCLGDEIIVDLVELRDWLIEKNKEYAKDNNQCTRCETKFGGSSPNVERYSDSNYCVECAFR